MTIRINSLNSQFYPRVAFMDCTLEQLQEVMSRAINIDFDVQLDDYVAKIKWEGQKTTLAIDPNGMKYSRIVATPKKVTIMLPVMRQYPGSAAKTFRLL